MSGKRSTKTSLPYALPTSRQRARLFLSAGEILDLWRRQNTLPPLRPDGKSNRPLTAYTISLEIAE